MLLEDAEVFSGGLSAASAGVLCLQQGFPWLLQVSAELELRTALVVHCRGISIMEDEGRIGDHTAGIAATDGTWHHIAVTWSSQDGLATLYDNGHKVWQGNA